MHIQDLLMQLLLKHPFYGYIAAAITIVETSEISTTRMVTEFSPILYYNKLWFEALSMEHALGAVLHELIHMIFMHPFRKGSREQHLWVIACDMAVNEYIDKSLLQDDAITVEKISKDIKEAIPKGKDAEFYYDIISRADSVLSFIEREKEIIVILRNGGSLRANNSADVDCSEINKSAFKSIFSDILAQAMDEGEVPAGIEGFIEEMYKAGEINWRNVLKRFLSGKGRILSKKSYKKESKRYEGLPGSKRIVGLRALLAIDESGSISADQSRNFFKEVFNIKRITNADLLVTEFDNECTEPVSIDKFIKNKRRVKSGGTDFRPIFNVADRLRIPLIIIFTDGEGIAPVDCNQLVLWIITKRGKRPAKFGHYIEYIP